MQQAEYNHNDFSNTAEADKALMVRFFYKSVQNKLESQKTGRPVFKEKLYVEIRIPGQRDAQACRPATHADKQRFPLHLEAFEKRTEPPTEGMPLAEWPKITRAQAEELAYMNVKTVEQLASMKDTNIGNFMGGYGLREKAGKWLEQNSAETEDREKEEMRTTIAELKAQMAELLAATTDTRAAAQAPAGAETNIPTPEQAGGLVSDLDGENTETAPPETEGKAVVVPAAPGTKKSRPRRNRKPK